MKAVIQRVTSTHVSINGELVASVGKGLTLLVGMFKDDTDEEMKWMAGKILKLRLFENWSKNVMEMDYELMVLSQFTLCFSFVTNKPDFRGAMSREDSSVAYHKFLGMLKKDYKADKVIDGKFGELRDCSIVNTGPVTIELDSRNRKMNHYKTAAPS